MEIIYISYSYSVLLNGISLLSESVISSADSPYRFIFYSSLVVALVYFLVMSQTRRLIRTKKLLKEKEISLLYIENQRSELELRNKNITDSLIYAKRIQDARLPSEEYFKKHFEDSFIFYKPKDIVSGDFYWIGEKGGKVFVAAADCTGHGVPGALLSMIGHDIIEKAIIEDNIETPSEFLAVLNRGLEKLFNNEKNTGTIITDGMDIGLCVVDRKHKKIEFAGASFPLYLIRNDNLIELKGDKLVIGMNTDDVSYTNHELDLLEDDIIYLFSDGYADQFGGAENKKFMYRRFRYILLNIHHLSVSDQKTILEDHINTWMGGKIQIDDIMVIGFRPLKYRT